MRRFLIFKFTDDFQDYENNQIITNQTCLFFMKSFLLKYFYMLLLNWIVKIMFRARGHYTVCKKDNDYMILGINMPNILLYCQPDNFFPKFRLRY